MAPTGQRARMAARRWMPPALLAAARSLRGRGAAVDSLDESNREIQADPYPVGLCSVIGGFLSPDQRTLAAFDYAIRNMPSSGAIVEIGSFLGLSTNLLAYLALKHRRDNPFFTVEPWIMLDVDEPISGYFDVTSEDFRLYAKETFIRNTTTFSPSRLPHTIELTSKDFFERWSARAELEDVFGRRAVLGGPLAFAYVDGEHTYEAVSGEFREIDRHLLPDGLILFDDSAEDVGVAEVARLVREVLAGPAYELVARTPHYFVRKLQP
jgi:hypothetical protein